MPEINISKFDILEPESTDTPFIITLTDKREGTLTLLTRTAVVKINLDEKSGYKFGEELSNFEEEISGRNNSWTCQPFSIKKSQNPALTALAVSYSNCDHIVILSSNTLTPIFQNWNTLIEENKIFKNSEFDFAGIYSTFIVGV